MTTKLNLGAGLQTGPGWINYDRSRTILIYRNRVLRGLLRLAHRLGLASKPDISAWPEATRSHDITSGLPHPDGSVDTIYASHVFEHIEPAALAFVLSECARVLKPRGVLRVVVPDLRIGVKRFLEGDHDWFERIGPEDPIADGLLRWLGLRASPKGGRIERAARRLLRTDDNGHMWMYDAESMSRRITDAGFRDVKVQPFGTGYDPDAAGLDSRPKDSVHIDARR